MSIVALQILDDLNRTDEIARVDELLGDVEPLPLAFVCGQCEGFRVNRRHPERGFCKFKLEYTAGEAIAWTHPDRNASDLACSKIKVNCEF